MRRHQLVYLGTVSTASLTPLLLQSTSVIPTLHINIRSMATVSHLLLARSGNYDQYRNDVPTGTTGDVPMSSARTPPSASYPNATHDNETFNPRMPYAQEEHAHRARNPLHGSSPSGVPTRKGTEAALASMRLRRMAVAEELDRDRSDLMKMRRMEGEGEDANNAPSDQEVKEWRQKRDSVDHADVSTTQRKARDAFVREILGSAPPTNSSQNSTASRTGADNTNNKPKRRYLNEDAEEKEKVRFRRFNADGTFADDVVREDSQTKQTVYDVPGTSSAGSAANPTPANGDEGFAEETPERIREAAEKFAKSPDSRYGAADLTYNSQKMAVILGICGIFFILIPGLVDPFGSLGDERGGTSHEEKAAIHKQQEQNMKDALTRQLKEKSTMQRSGAEGLAGDEQDSDDFYGSGNTSDTPQSLSFLQTFNPVVFVANYVGWYGKVLAHADETRHKMAVMASDVIPTATGEAAKEVLKKQRDSARAA